jgi:hypothetical protein
MTLADFSMWSTLITLNYLVPINSEKFPRLTKYLKMLEGHEGYAINREGAERHANYVLKCECENFDFDCYFLIFY